MQRELENARYLWERCVEKNRCERAACVWRQLAAIYPPPTTACTTDCRCLCRRDVEERAEQLKAISNLSALIAGFALVSFLQFDFSPSAASEGVQLAFGLTIALTVRPLPPLCSLCMLFDGQPPPHTAVHVVFWEMGHLHSCLTEPAGWQRSTPAAVQ